MVQYLTSVGHRFSLGNLKTFDLVFWGFLTSYIKTLCLFLRTQVYKSVLFFFFFFFQYFREAILLDSFQLSGFSSRMLPTRRLIIALASRACPHWSFSSFSQSLPYVEYFGWVVVWSFSRMFLLTCSYFPNFLLWFDIYTLYVVLFGPWYLICFLLWINL